MSPITNRQDGRAVYTYYRCSSRVHHGPDVPCQQSPLRRDLVDGAVYAYFRRVAFDIDGTRKALKDEATRKLTEYDSLRTQTEAELVRADARWPRSSGVGRTT